ncbi:MAG: SDR family oxidoreductase [Negativicutes bacterium]|nr:SDR family oxidoreductase [Negativicutes bacterium]
MDNIFSLKNKRIIVSGASSGIGLACAQMIALSGGQVILVARDLNRLNSALKSLSGRGHVSLSLDITDFDVIQSILADQANDQRIDGLVCCAGVQQTLPLRSMSADRYAKMFKINVTASLEMARVVTRKRVFSETGGSIVFLSSIMGLCGKPGLAAYAASKGALISAAKSIAIELAPRKIRVNCISPGHILNTGMSSEIESILSDERKKAIDMEYPLGLGQPKDVASSVVFFLSDAARWITGTNLIVDGGYSA